MNYSFNSQYYDSFFDRSQTKEVPTDWHLILVDVKDSTRSVADGKYRAVGFLAASPISALRNAFPREPIPFVFGGDGALFLVPSALRNEILDLFCSVRDQAHLNVGLSLRVASLSVSDLAIDKHDLKYGFAPVGPHEGFWFFRGNGFRIAENKLKEQTEAVPPQSVVALPSFNGLSCRLNPFLSRWGQMANLIIFTRLSPDEEDLFFRDFFSRLLGRRPLHYFSPIHDSNLSRPWFSSSWEMESRLRRGKPRSSRVFLENGLGNLFLKLNIYNRATGKPSTYQEALIAQSDWIKMDGSLKLVLDLPPQEEALLCKLLEEHEKSKTIQYGISFSPSATMICQLDSGKDHRHLHFVDGSEGGLTRAASDLKRKLSAAGGT